MVASPYGCPHARTHARTCYSVFARAGAFVPDARARGASAWSGAGGRQQSCYGRVRRSRRARAGLARSPALRPPACTRMRARAGSARTCDACRMQNGMCCNTRVASYLVCCMSCHTMHFRSSRVTHLTLLQRSTDAAWARRHARRRPNGSQAAGVHWRQQVLREVDRRPQNAVRLSVTDATVRAHTRCAGVCARVPVRAHVARARSYAVGMRVRAREGVLARGCACGRACAVRSAQQ